MTIQDHLSLEGINDENLSIFKAIGVDYVAVMHPPPPKPDDPPRPEPLGGAARILSTLDDFECLFNAVPSHVNTMLFCQGCVREMGEDVPIAIRRIGAQNKIAAVHFRNLRGTPNRFQEVFADEGEVDMYQAMYI